ncbi:hypothetical protein KQH61_03810 [bacterium]|nr:hypothetical protein [bacterium]MCB2179028.1 hypothetical protein [bacterium]
MTKKWIGIWGKSFQRSCLYRLIAVGIVIPLFTILILVPLYFANQPGVTDKNFLLILIIPVSIFLFLLFVGVFGFLFWSIRTRAAWLDEIFTPLGLEGRRYTLTGRQYHGKIRGRDVDVLFTRGPMLSIYISTDVFTQAVFSDPSDVSQNLTKLTNRQPLTSGDDDLTVYATDDAWGSEFIQDPEVQSILRTLIFDESPFAIQQVILEPGYFLLRLYRSNAYFNFKIPPDQGKGWVRQLLRLAELAERQNSPQESLPPSSLSTNLRQGNAARWAWLILGGLIAVSVCVAVIGIIIALMVESG